MEGTPVKEAKYTSVIIDTVNQLQNDLFIDLLDKKGKADFDDWKDFGVEILQLFHYIKNTIKADIVLVLGVEGTGKTVGGKYLDPDQTVWMNCDQKPLTFLGARKAYNKERKNYSEPKTYEKVKDALLKINQKKANDRLVIFVLGHVEVFKGEGPSGTAAQRQRLKVLGKMATKLNIEGAVSHCYYTKVIQTGKTPEEKFRLIHQNDGFNTARSPEGYWEGDTIPNNYQLILDKILSDR